MGVNKNSRNSNTRKNSVSKDKSIKKSNKELKKDIKKMKGKKKRKIGKIILITFLILFLLGVIAAGVAIGMIFSTYSEDWKMNKEDLVMGDANSRIVDSEGKELAVLTGDETRKPVTLGEMSRYLPKAYVAMEDERFYEHSGIDIKRTLGAILQYVQGNSSYGGSSITQQVVKNLTKEDERAIDRKIKEWGRAYNVEQILSKDEILQLYLNLIYVGGPTGQSLHGVEVAANYYFDKSAKDLSLAECAYLAGINSSPSSYKPFDNLDEDGNMPEAMEQKINKKVIDVLYKMKELGTSHKAGISEEEYNLARAEVEEGLEFERGETRTSIYSFHTESAINEVIEDYMEEKECTRDFAKNYIYSSGLTIHTTQVSSIQKAMEKEYEDDILVLKSKERKDDDGNYVKSQSAMVIIDHQTGYVVGSVGQIGEKTTNFGLNRAVDSTRQTGSSMKPLAVIVPGLEEGIITAATVYDDVKTVLGGKNVPNYYHGYKGLSTVRYAIEISENTVPAKIITQLTPRVSMQYLEKMGITTVDKDEDNSYSLALGGMYWGVSPLEMAGAYASIANSGVYIEPTFYTKVVDSNGGIILETSQESNRVMSEANAYVAQSILTQPVVGPNGTARICKVTGIDTAAKTGTTDGYKDRWLCGFTPYYTAAIWYGFDMPEYIASGTNPGSDTFDRVMNKIHKELPNKKFEEPSKIVRVAVCKDSGLLADENCKDTINGNRVYTEVFVKGTAPSKKCDVHVTAKVCKVDGKKNKYELANDNCPDAKELTFITRANSDKKDAWEDAADAKYMLPTKVCDRHTDTKPPVIKLNGNEKIVLKVGEKYVEEGATAVDDTDGDLTEKIKISGKVNTSIAGTYFVTYTVEDECKNEASKTRTIVVEKVVKPIIPPTIENTISNIINGGGNNNTLSNSTNTNTITNTVDEPSTNTTVDTSANTVTNNNTINTSNSITLTNGVD